MSSTTVARSAVKSVRRRGSAVASSRANSSVAGDHRVDATILPRALQAFQASYPGISIRLRELTAADLLECIRRKEVDFGIGVEIDRSTEFQFDDPFEDPIYAIATNAFRFRRRSSVRPRRILCLSGVTQFQIGRLARHA